MKVEIMKFVNEFKAGNINIQVLYSELLKLKQANDPSKGIEEYGVIPIYILLPLMAYQNTKGEGYI